MSATTNNWLLINHLQYQQTGSLSSVKPTDNGFEIIQLTDESASGKKYAPWFLGVTEKRQIVLFDVETKAISFAEKMPKDAVPAYAYLEAGTNHMWFINDGDKDTGNDTLNCGENGSSVTVIDKGDGKSLARHIKTLCVGRGHHVPTFVRPSEKFPLHPNIVYISNLLDGTIDIVNNDTHSPQYLNIITSINLCEPEKEKDGKTSIPNNAFPHGKQFSVETGKIYSLNNGYGTVAVFDPSNHNVDTLIDLKGCSNLLISPDGKFVIGKGADRKKDGEHVLGKLSVIDTRTNQVARDYEIPDFYPSTYRFSANGKKLFVSSAATGKGNQKENLKINTLYVYDVTSLPELTLEKIIEVGNADCSRRPIAMPVDANIELLFVPNPTDGTLSIIDTQKNEVIETLTIGEPGAIEFNFSFWQSSIYGA